MAKKLNELVSRLAVEQEVECSRPEKNANALKESIARDYVHVMFKTTGTEVGIHLSQKDCDFMSADFDAQTGKIRLVGALTLNYDKVKCITEIDLSTCDGIGRLIPVDDTEYASLIK